MVSELRSETVLARLLATCRGELSAVIAWLMSKCLWYEVGGSGREELKKYPVRFPAVLWIVNVSERKPKKKRIMIGFFSFVLVIDCFAYCSLSQNQ